MIRKIHDSHWLGKKFEITDPNNPQYGLVVKVNEVFDNLGKVTLTLSNGDNVVESTMGKTLTQTDKPVSDLSRAIGNEGLEGINFDGIILDEESGSKVIKPENETSENIERNDVTSDIKPKSETTYNKVEENPMFKLFSQSKRDEVDLELNVKLYLPKSTFIGLIEDNFEIDKKDIIEYLIEISDIDISFINNEIKKALYRHYYNKELDED